MANDSLYLLESIGNFLHFGVSFSNDLITNFVGEIEQGCRAQRSSLTFDEIGDTHVKIGINSGYGTKKYENRRPTISGYGYHRRRLRINQESRGSRNRSSMCGKSGKHNLVSSSVHRNLLIVILISFIPLLLIQGKPGTYQYWTMDIIVVDWAILV